MKQKAKITLNDTHIRALSNMTAFNMNCLMDILIGYAAYGDYDKCIDGLSDCDNMKGLFILFADCVEFGNHKEPKGEEQDGE